MVDMRRIHSIIRIRIVINNTEDGQLEPYAGHTSHTPLKSLGRLRPCLCDFDISFCFIITC